MLIFDADKNKKIQMAIESSGIDNDKLKFVFVVDTEKVQYGFPCMFNEGRVEVDIPPLQDVVMNLEAGTYTARLDVTGDDKYYLKPFNESIEVKLTPSIKKVSMDETNVSEDVRMAISSLIEVKETPVESKPEGPENTEIKEETGIGAFFNKK